MTPLMAVILSLGIPIVVIIMVFLKKMKKNQQEKEIRQLIIENKTDPETAKLLIDEPKKAPKPGTIDVGNLRFACMLLGVHIFLADCCLWCRYWIVMLILRRIALSKETAPDRG